MRATVAGAIEQHVDERELEQLKLVEEEERKTLGDFIGQVAA